MKNEMNIKRGNIWFVDLTDATGSEQKGVRPAVVVQNNMGNKYSPLVTVIPLTSQVKKSLPTHVLVQKNNFNNLTENSVALVENIVTIDKSKILPNSYIGDIAEFTMKKIDKAIEIQLNLNNDKFNIDNVIEKSQNLYELERIINLDEIKKDKFILKSILSSIRIQYQELADYCQQYNETITKYYVPDSDFKNLAM